MDGHDRAPLVPWLLGQPRLYPWFGRALRARVMRRLRPGGAASPQAASAVRVCPLSCAPDAAPRLDGDQVLLRRFERRDISALRTLTFGDVSQAYRRCQLLWTIVDRASGRVAGYCGLTPMALDGKQVLEVGYSVVPEFRGRGMATEAARLIAGDAFARLRLPRVIAIVEPQNAASLAVLRKCGFHYSCDGCYFGTPVNIFERGSPLDAPSDGGRSSALGAKS